MARKTMEDEFAEKWEPSEQDVKDLRQALQGYEQKHINGKLVSRFDQHCIKQKVGRYDDFGSWCINYNKVGDYTKMLAIHAVMEREDDSAHRRIMEAFPEKRKEFLDHIRETGRPKFMPKRMPEVTEEQVVQDNITL